MTNFKNARVMIFLQILGASELRDLPFLFS